MTEDRLAKISAHVPGVLYQYLMRPDGSTCFPYASRGVSRIYGYDPEDLLEDAAHAFGAIHRDDRDRVFRSIERSARSMTTWRCEYRVNHPERGVVWARGHSEPERLPDGSILWHGYIFDVTDERRAADEAAEARAALERERARFDLAMRSANDGVWEWDVRSGAMSYSARNAELLGFDPADIRPDFAWWREKVHPDDVGACEAAIAAHLKAGEPYDVTYRIRAADGSWRWWRSRGLVARDETGAPSRMAGSNSDVTALVEALRAAEEERLLFSMAVSGSRSAVVDIDAMTDVATFSERNFDLLGEDIPENAGDGWWRARVHPDDLPRAQEAYRALVEDGVPYDVTYRIRAADGSWRRWRTRAQSVRDESGRVVRVVGLNSDVTELVEAREKAERASAMKTQFLSNMSHELRTPLNGVLGMAQVLARSGLEPAQRRCVDVILQSGDALLCLLNDVLDIARIEAGAMTLSRTPYALASVAREAAGSLEAMATEKGLAFRVAVSPDCEFHAVGDAKRLRQAIVNLVGNAVKFTEEGEVAVRVDMVGGAARCRVEDTGPGVPEDMRAAVFERFRQVDGSTTRRHDGSGLGLAITQDIVRLAGGEIGLEPRPGGGSVFWFAWPAPEAAEAPAAATG